MREFRTLEDLDPSKSSFGALKKEETRTKTCKWCKRSVSINQFARANDLFFQDGLSPVCNSCINVYLKEKNFAWDEVDKICQLLDLPFIVEQVERISSQNPQSFFSLYSEIFRDKAYSKIDWKYYNTQYTELRDRGLIEEELPLIREQKYKKLRDTWGQNYSEEQLNYLDDFYQGLLLSQNINGTLQVDQARKLCKLSLQIDELIRAGDKDVEKFMSSYDKIIKAGDFTPKNVKNAADFDSVAELVLWAEKRGWLNKFYDGATRDVIDETIKNIEAYNQRLYINEGGIGEEIGERLAALQLGEKNEEPSIYNLDQPFAEDEYENEGWGIEDNDDFVSEGGDMNE